LQERCLKEVVRDKRAASARDIRDCADAVAFAK